MSQDQQKQEDGAKFVGTVVPFDQWPGEVELSDYLVGESCLDLEQERRASALYHAKANLDSKAPFSKVTVTDLVRLANWILDGGERP